MPIAKSLIQLCGRAPVHSRWVGWFHSRDKPLVGSANGGRSPTSGAEGRLSIRAVYATVVSLIALSCVAGTFATAHEVPWRLGTPHNLWEPALW